MNVSGNDATPKLWDLMDTGIFLDTMSRPEMDTIDDTPPIMKIKRKKSKRKLHVENVDENDEDDEDIED